ncbi:hypothetical protein [Nocardioides sp. NPDC047086]|uniref:hypothetical protein n=1 Tax=Nocardioides sp. NPDC047086 TaxID=3154810 RepID=UPI0033E89AB7
MTSSAAGDRSPVRFNRSRRAAEREGFAGSDRSRLQTLRTRLTPDDISWTALTGRDRIDAATALEILTAED